jgi:hypothetical protein
VYYCIIETSKRFEFIDPKRRQENESPGSQALPPKMLNHPNREKILNILFHPAI